MLEVTVSKPIRTFLVITKWIIIWILFLQFAGVSLPRDKFLIRVDPVYEFVIGVRGFDFSMRIVAYDLSVVLSK